MIDYTLPLEKLPDPLPIEPLRKPFDVTIMPPGSKSITNRAYVLAALAQGESRIIRPLRADDTDLLLKALCTLGAQARWEGENVLIKGVNGRFPRGGHVNLGDGGTPTRFMIACACLAAEPVVVDGSKRMRERPIAEGIDMLRQLGATIEYVEEEGRLPVRVEPSDQLTGGELVIETTQSSQSVSAILLIAPFLKETTRLVFNNKVTSESYIDVTADVLASWRAIISREVYGRAAEPTHVYRGTPIVVVPRPLQSLRFEVEADASSALYWAMASAITPTAGVRLKGLRWNSTQPDIEILELLHLAGARYGSLPDRTIFIRGRKGLGQVSADASGFPDGSMALAVAAARGDQPTRITGLRTLRVKETDRIAALANELRKVGCAIESGEDWISIDPRGSESRATNPVIIETYNDHRMAMAFAVLGLARPGISIRNPACVRKSYPTFWQDFAKLYQ
jgi:3-phosphoshikimate 1-carboxyvinyltransferase